MQTDLNKNRIPAKSLLTKIRDRLTSGGIMTVIFLAILALFAFYVNRNIRIGALYMDDLYMWSFYGEESLFEFTFPFRTSTRFRPVCWFLTYLQMATVGTSVKGYVTFNIIANIVLAWAVYGMGKRISRNRVAAFLASLVFLASRFSYYQIGQALGYMETLACLFSLYVLFFLYRYMTVRNDFTGTDIPEDAPLFSRSDQRYFAAAMFFYVLVSFTHERFITLVPLFYLVLVIKLLKEKKNNRKIWFHDTRFLWIIPAVTLAGIMLIRFIFIGRSIPAGTGGTQVTETFSVSQTLRYCLSQVLYLLGINDGPEYLCAIPWENTPQNIKNLIRAGIVCYGILGLAFLISMIRDLTEKAVSEAQIPAGKSGSPAAVPAQENLTHKEKSAPLPVHSGREASSDMHVPDVTLCTREQKPAAATPGRRRFCRKAAVSLLFAGFIAICIVSSSITVRLEMRWIYVSFAAMQLFACYMITAVGTMAEGTSNQSAASFAGALEQATVSSDGAVNLSPDSAGKTLEGKSSGGETSDSKSSGGETSGGETSDSKSSGGETSDSKTSDGETSDGKTSDGKTSEGKTSDGQISDGRISAGRKTPPVANPVILAATLVYMIYAALSINTNVFCRGYIDNIYFMEGQNRANSIAGQTIGTYGGDEVLGKIVFLVGTSYDISDFYSVYFFRPFDPEKTGQGSRLVLVDTVEEALEYLKQNPAEEEEAGEAWNTAEDITSLRDRAIFLTEDPVTKKYIPLEF